MVLFGGHESAHGTHGVPVKDGLKWEIKTTARSLREPVTAEMWEKHLAGKRPLGIIPIRSDNTCLWGSIDIDQYAADLLKIVASVEAARLPLVPCRSKSGGLHLFLFLRAAQPAAAVLAALRNVAAQLGFAGSEIFPKQSQILVERGDIGNWMVMPYYGDTYGGKIKEQLGLKKTGAEMTVNEFLSTAEKSRVDDKTFQALGKIAAKPGSSKNKSRGAGPFSNGPPCLQHMASGGFPEGGRNNALFMIGLYHKRADPSNWQHRVELANQGYMKPPLTTDEVAAVFRSLEKKEYEYTCQNEPMKSHCDAALCRGREFGVGRGGDYPVISGLSKLCTEPPIWFVDVEDKRLEVSTDDLLYYQKFQRACADQLHRFYNSMKQADWVRTLGEASAGLTLIEAPPDAGAAGRLKELLEEFLTNRAKGERREDLLRGVSWESEDEKRYYFRIRDLQNFVTREGVRDVTRGQLVRLIERLGGGHWFFNVKAKGINCWFIPSGAVSGTPDLDPPDVKGEAI